MPKRLNSSIDWLEGKYDRLPELLADLVRRQVDVIATLSTFPTEVAKGITKDILAARRSGLMPE